MLKADVENITKIVPFTGRKGFQKILFSKRSVFDKIWKKLNIFSVSLVFIFLFAGFAASNDLIKISDTVLLGAVFLFVSIAAAFAFSQMKTVQYEIKQKYKS
ncbi:MAG: hypothetical protein AB1394_16790, partial [Bacteroidota bacterium]